MYIFKQEDSAQKIELFTSRFLPRYLEMCDDIDDEVVLSIVNLLITIDR